MKQTKPLISILVPVHNSAEYLAECITSLINQTYKNIEIIAIDDNSSDSSKKILRSFKKQDKRIKIHSNIKRYGIGITLNRLVKHAKGEFISFMSANDIASPNKIGKELKFLINNQNVVAIGSQCTFIDEKGRKIGRSDYPNENELIYKNPLHGISMQFETILINKTKLPKDLLKFRVDQNPFVYSDLVLKLTSYGELANLEDFLHFHRNDPRVYFSDLKKNILSYVKLWLKSKALYDYQPSIKAFFSPLIKFS